MKLSTPFWTGFVLILSSTIKRGRFNRSQQYYKWKFQNILYQQFINTIQTEQRITLPE